MQSAPHGPALRPLRLGEILDRSIRLYRRHFLLFVGIVAVIEIPLALVQLAGTYLINRGLLRLSTTTPEDFQSIFEIFGADYSAGSSLNLLSALLTIVLVQGVAAAAISRVVAGSYFGHQPPAVLEAYRNSKSHWFPLVLALLLAGLLAIGLLFWWLVPCVGWISGGGMLLFLTWVIFPLLPPVVVVEQHSPVSAWRRAWELARRRFWWLLAFGFALYLFNLLVIGAPAAAVAVFGQLIIDDPQSLPGSPTLLLAAQAVLQTLVTVLNAVLYIPFLVTAFTLVYFDLRVRYEGLDLALAAGEMERRGESPEAELTPMGAAPRLVAGQVITWGELGSFSLITVGIIGSLMLLYGALFAIAFALLAAFVV